VPEGRRLLQACVPMWGCCCCTLARPRRGSGGGGSPARGRGGGGCTLARPHGGDGSPVQGRGRGGSPAQGHGGDCCSPACAPARPRRRLICARPWRQCGTPASQAATACGLAVGVRGRVRELLQRAPGLASRSSAPAAMAAASARTQNSWLTLDGSR
jgi:hypothetical protein